MPSSSIYSEIVSQRSRRLRTVGIVLLVAVVAMVSYGYLRLMPSVAESLRDNPVRTNINAVTHGAGTGLLEPKMTRSQRLGKLRVAVALAYWGVCALLLVGLVAVAWLDLREVSRRYFDERRSLWTEAVDRIDKPDRGT